MEDFLIDDSGSPEYILATANGGTTWQIFFCIEEYSECIATLQCAQETAEEIVAALNYVMNNDWGVIPGLANIADGSAWN
jgi:hypothetical protein